MEGHDFFTETSLILAPNNNTIVLYLNSFVICNICDL